MKSGPGRAKTIISALVVFLNIALVALGQSFPLYSSSNAPSAETSEMGKSMVLQPIEMNNTPLSFGIEHLAQRAHVNIIVDEQLQEWWDMTGYFGRHLHPEPFLTFRWTGITPKQALRRLLLEHDLVMVEDLQTSIARVTFTNRVIAPMDANVFGNNTNIGSLIQFEDVPLTIAVENLARQAGVNYILDPQIGYGQPDKNGQIKSEPVLSVHWENVTLKQAWMAVLKNYDFAVNKDPASPILLIRAKNHPAHFMDVALLGMMRWSFLSLNFRMSR